MPWEDPAGFARLMHALAFLGYNPLLLPRAPVADRVALVMAHLTRT